MVQFFVLVLFIILFLLIDLYALNGLQALAVKWRILRYRHFKTIYWSVSIFFLLDLVYVIYHRVGFAFRLALIVGFFGVLLFKVCFVIFLMIDDLRRAIIRLTKKQAGPPSSLPVTKDNTIPRSQFLVKAGLLAGAVPLAALRISMKSGLYDYHIKRQTLYLHNLPKAFDGIRIGQISDIHSGSFHNHTAVLGGVEMLMREKTDVVFFTGDLVNEFSFEMKNYQDIFSKVKAPLGVYSVTGNHDYGDYHSWLTPEAKRRNHQEIVNAHKNMGWDILINSNRRLKVDGEEIGIVGIENWGQFSKFPKYGRMDLAVENTDDLPVKLLLSHDPSHWRAQVLPQYPQIDMVFAGHTHGMQMGIRTDNFQWSPIEYIYNEWAGLYTEGHQQLYVNVGYGFLAIHGRVGILPEITIFTLKAGTAPSLAKA